MMGHTLQISVSDALYETLTKTAQQTGQPLEALAAMLLKMAAEQHSHDPLEAFIGAFDSRGADWADRHDNHLGQAAIAPNSDLS